MPRGEKAQRDTAVPGDDDAGDPDDMAYAWNYMSRNEPMLRLLAMAVRRRPNGRLAVYYAMTESQEADATNGWSCREPI